VPVFGILKRGGRVNTVMNPDAKRAALLPIIKERLKPDSVVCTDSFRSYEHVGCGRLSPSPDQPSKGVFHWQKLAYQHHSSTPLFLL